MDTSDLPRGSIVAGYTILKRLGAGGMGIVYAAYDHDLERSVAIKLLRRASERAEKRFRNEARALARLSHPNVAGVYRTGSYKGHVFIAMEHVEGLSLRQWLAKTRSWQEIVAVFLEAGQGLVAAHRAGLVHRDFKPENVMIGRDGRVKVLDFGIAKALEEYEDNEPEGGKVGDDSIMAPDRATGTNPGETLRTRGPVGTLLYMAPEQLLVGSIDARADQYSFCVALYEALFSQHPLLGKSTNASVGQILRGRILSPPPEVRVPRWLKHTILQGLARSPAQRFPHMAMLLHELQRKRRHIWIWGGVAALGLAAAVLTTKDAAVAEPQLSCRDVAKLGTSPAQPDAQMLVGYAKQRINPTYAASFERALDEYVAQWEASRQSICQVRETPPSAARIACLEDARTRWESLVSALQESPALTSNGLVALSSLVAPRHCAQSELGHLLPAFEGPTHETVRGIRTALARADVAIALGQGAIDRTAFADDVDRIGDPVLSAEIALREGVEAFHSGDFSSARRWLTQSYELAISADNQAVAANAAIELVAATGMGLGQLEQSLQWSGRAQALLGRKRSTATALIRSIHMLALAYHESESHSRALGQLNHAIDLLQNLPGDNRLQTGRLLDATARSFQASSRFADESRYLKDALMHYESVLGPNHPDCLDTMQRLVTAASKSGDLSRALAVSERMLDLRTEALGPSDPEVIKLHLQTADLYRRAGRRKEATVRYRSTLSLLSSDSENRPVRAKILLELGEQLLTGGNPKAARANFEEVLTIFTSDDAEASQWAVEALVGIGRTYLREGSAAAAVDPLQRAIATASEVENADVAAARAEFILAQALWSTREKRRARKLAQQAYQRFAALGHPYQGDADDVRRWIRAR